MAVLLIAPASWSVQTLGHATSGTFPAGGPATTGQFGGGPPGGGGNGGGPFAGDTSTLAEAVAYVEANGGGTIAVSSQSGAAGQLIAQGADVAAIGGFSGRESEVSVEWLAQAVADGRIRYVLTDGADGLGKATVASGRARSWPRSRSSGRPPASRASTTCRVSSTSDRAAATRPRAAAAGSSRRRARPAS